MALLLAVKVLICVNDLAAPGMAGYFNTTSAIDAVQFKFASGNIDAGTIKLYGLKDS